MRVIATPTHRDVVDSLIGRISRSFHSFLKSPQTDPNRMGVMIKSRCCRLCDSDHRSRVVCNGVVMALVDHFYLMVSVDHRLDRIDQFGVVMAQH
jgi:hypothetical protein